ncbi:uncharacterized protein Z518_02675 [Rhinocladiella mackenziei CBS 650.93]|uniref:Uncharacterized protein n=1 Tax=Rhinocladiella mackenziei CBS 650.93 TaxID=1442369 RepID=A0A0D2JFJ8_9EURO|nr:uncharacterized protein Z518_02675 [Rhinocladiella mackenziei CBS 650.93]KIX08020.1 hypothetical protein Z518_02675 [Rhinocladiella mackenziei CBS 650.93]
MRTGTLQRHILVTRIESAKIWAAPVLWNGMPPQSFPDTTAAPAEPSTGCPSNRSRCDASTGCPAVQSLDDGTSDEQPGRDGLDSGMLYPASPFRNSGSELALDAVTSEPDLPHIINDLFDLYLRSPTTSPSPSDTARSLSGTITVQRDGYIRKTPRKMEHHVRDR